MSKGSLNLPKNGKVDTHESFVLDFRDFLNLGYELSN